MTRGKVNGSRRWRSCVPTLALHSRFQTQNLTSIGCGRTKTRSGGPKQLTTVAKHGECLSVKSNSRRYPLSIVDSSGLCKKFFPARKTVPVVLLQETRIIVFIFFPRLCYCNVGSCARPSRPGDSGQVRERLCIFEALLWVGF